MENELLEKMNQNELLGSIKKHIRLEEGMDESMLPFYISSAIRYVNKKTGTDEEYLVTMVATVMFQHRLASEDLREALNALEPVFALEVLTNEPT